MAAPVPQKNIQELYAQAVDALNRAQWAHAGRLAAQLLGGAPEHAGVRFIAGVAALGGNDIRSAVLHLRRAVELNPGRVDYLAQLARAYASSGALGDAIGAATRALNLPLNDALSCDTLGVVLTRCNEHAAAAKAFAAAVQLHPRRAGYRYNLATSLMFVGDIEGAEREYEACVGLEPGQWRAHLALSQLRTQTAASNHMERLKGLLSMHGQHAEARLYLNLAMAKELEDLKEYPDSFRYLVEGKQAVARARKYDPEKDARLFKALAAEFDGSRQEMDTGFQSSEPIFVVGMPRSGTTLVDRIISSHPLVHSAGELMNFPIAVHRVSGARGRALLDEDVIAKSSTMDWGRVGEMYVQSTRPGTGRLPHFVDKLPHNFQYVGHMLRALPRAKIVLLRRNAMDTCLGNFRQLFALDSSFYDYSFDLLDVGRYYVSFDRLMSHWMRVFPGRIFQVNYEDLVRDQEGITRGLIRYCGLPWDDSCLRFHENQAPTATASVVQVREPLHARYQQRWRHYGSAMEPLRALLQQAGIEVPAAG